MTKSQWKAFAKILLVRKNQLEEDLRLNDFSLVESVAYSKREQIGAIDLLLGQVPCEFLPKNEDKLALASKQ